MTPLEAKEKVKLELLEIRNKALSTAQKNKATALKNKTYHQLDNEERALILEISKLDAFGQDYANEQQKLNTIKQQKIEILQSLGLSQTDLEPQFQCKKCNDTGITSNGACACFKEKLAKVITPTQDLNLANFSQFKAQGETPEAQQKSEKLKTFLISFAEGKQPYLNLLLSGKVGVGKTFLAECTLSEFKKQNKRVFKVSAFAMNELFTKFHTTFDFSKQDYLDPLLNCDVLLIDDLGTEPIKRNITREYLYLILNERANSNKKTIITTNLSMEDILAIYNERIFSRLANKKTTFKFNIEGVDLRLQ